MSKNLTKTFAIILAGSMMLTGCAGQKPAEKPEESAGMPESSVVEESSIQEGEQSSEAAEGEVQEMTEQDFGEFLDAFLKAYDEGDSEALKEMCSEDVYASLNTNDIDAMTNKLLERLGLEDSESSEIKDAVSSFSQFLTGDAVREYEIVDMTVEDGMASAIVDMMQGPSIQSLQDYDMKSALEKILGEVKENNMEEMKGILENGGEEALVQYLYEKGLPSLFDEMSSAREAIDSIKYEKTIRAELGEDGLWKIIEFLSNPVGTEPAE